MTLSYMKQFINSGTLGKKEVLKKGEASVHEPCSQRLTNFPRAVSTHTVVWSYRSYLSLGLSRTRWQDPLAPIVGCPHSLLAST